MQPITLLLTVADTTEEIRRCDVYRLLSEAKNARSLNEFSQWLLQQNITNAVRTEVEECIEEINEEVNTDGN